MAKDPFSLPGSDLRDGNGDIPGWVMERLRKIAGDPVLGNRMKSQPVFILVLALLYSLSAFFAMMLRPDSRLSRLLVQFPAQGEDQASDNLFKMVFILPPLLVSLIFGSAILGSFFASRLISNKAAKNVGIVVFAIGLSAFLFVSVQAHRDPAFSWNFVLFFSALYLGYVGVFSLVTKGMISLRRFIHSPP